MATIVYLDSCRQGIELFYEIHLFCRFLLDLMHSIRFDSLRYANDAQFLAIQMDLLNKCKTMVSLTREKKPNHFFALPNWPFRLKLQFIFSKNSNKYALANFLQPFLKKKLIGSSDSLSHSKLFQLKPTVKMTLNRHQKIGSSTKSDSILTILSDFETEQNIHVHSNGQI